MENPLVRHWIGIDCVRHGTPSRRMGQYMMSETGVIDLDESEVVSKGVKTEHNDKCGFEDGGV